MLHVEALVGFQTSIEIFAAERSRSPALELHAKTFGNGANELPQRFGAILVLPRWTHKFQPPPVVGDEDSLIADSLEQGFVSAPVNAVKDEALLGLREDGAHLELVSRVKLHTPRYFTTGSDIPLSL